MSSQTLIPTAITISALWITWRIWRFTLSPKWLHPDHPKPYPYLVPFLGHVRGMTVNASKVYTQGREYFGNTREVFSLTVMGEEFYIVTSAEDISSIYRNTTALEFDPIVRDIMGAFGVNPPTLDKMFDKDPHVDGGKSWMDVCHDDFKVQMHPGPRLKTLEATLLGNIDQSLTWEGMATAKGVISTSESPKSITFSLWKWCGHVLVDSATRAFFGDGLYRVAPNMLEDFFAFDEEGWKLHYKYPEFAAKEMYQAKRNGEVAFAKYLALPKEERADASWIVERMEQGMQDLGISDPGQRGPMVFAFYQLVNANAYRLCFWCLAYLLHQPDLLSAIKAEIQPAFKTSPGDKDASPSLDMTFLVENCPLLSSFYDELLRVVNDPIGTRLVTHKTTVGGKVLLPGRKILMPYRQLHFNPEVFGPNAKEFDARRFLEHSSGEKKRVRDLRKSTSWRPFGGGVMHCPGRFLARREVCMFVAVVLNRFDLRLAGKGEQKFPKLDESIPSGGILMPIPGDDVIVEVRPIN